MAAAEEICSCLPEELLECTFKYLDGDNRSFMSLSLVSKQFLYITNRIRFSVTITDETIPFLPRLFHRFPNLTSLNLTIVPKTVEEVNALLTLISTFPLDIKSIRLRPKRILRPIQIPANGLIALSKTMKNMTSLSFYQMGHFDKKNLFLIADCFPLLQELNLCNPWLTSDTDFMVDHKDPLLALPLSTCFIIACLCGNLVPLSTSFDLLKLRAVMAEKVTKLVWITDVITKWRRKLPNFHKPSPMHCL